MSSQEEAGIIRRGGKPQGGGQEGGRGEPLVTAPSKAADVGLLFPLSRERGTPFGLRIEFQIMAHLVPCCTISSGYPAYMFLRVMTTVSQFKSPAFSCGVINLSICCALDVQVPTGLCFFTARCIGLQIERPQGLQWNIRAEWQLFSSKICQNDR